MKRLVLFLALVLAAPAYAGDLTGFYAGGKGIVSLQETGTLKGTGAFDNGSKRDCVGGVGVFAGWDFYPKFSIPIRLEGEYDWRAKGSGSWSLKDAPRGADGKLDVDWDVQTFFLNAYLDWHNDSPFTPYVGGGIGGASIHATGDWHASRMTPLGKRERDGSYSAGGIVPAWHVGAGVAWSFDEHVAVDAAYRYVNTSTMGRLDIDPSAHEFSLGVRLTF